jgi:hypothetical protein
MRDKYRVFDTEEEAMEFCFNLKLSADPMIKPEEGKFTVYWYSAENAPGGDPIDES